MNLPCRLFVFAALLFCVACLAERSNAQTKSDTGATLSGKVTIKGKPAPGLVVGMRLTRPEGLSPTYKAKTDREGNYRITKIAAGSYLVTPIAPNLALNGAPDYQQGQSVIINEGENVEDINFELVPAGVITGKVTDSEGRPLIEEPVTLINADNNNPRLPFNTQMTDDRGIYRIFGVPAGRYRVSVGDPRFGRGPRRQVPIQTFYPNVTEAAKAEIVEVSEGSEATKIDIVVGETPTTYTLSGVVLDAESSAPITNVDVLLTRIEVVDANNTRGYSEYINARPDAQGRFQLTNIRPGKYEVSAYPGKDSDVRMDAPVRIDVVDQDVSGLTLKMTHGVSITGTVAFEGKNTPAQMPSMMWVMVNTRTDGNPGQSSSRQVRVSPDGSFYAGGLLAGAANLNVEIPSGKGFSLARVERDGVVQPDGRIQIQNGEHVSGVRLVVTYSNGTIRGAIRFENGTLPPTARVFVQVIKEGEQTPLPRGGQVDARGHFLIEGLAAGNYELRAIVYGVPALRRPAMSIKQLVTVNENEPVDVTLTVDLAPPDK